MRTVYIRSMTTFKYLYTVKIECSDNTGRKHYKYFSLVVFIDHYPGPTCITPLRYCSVVSPLLELLCLALFIVEVVTVVRTIDLHIHGQNRVCSPAPAVLGQSSD